MRYANVAHVMNALQAIIREFRDQRGWTQQDLADKAGISRMTVVNAEKNKAKHNANSGTIDKIARAFGLGGAQDLWVEAHKITEVPADG